MSTESNKQEDFDNAYKGWLWFCLILNIAIALLMPYYLVQRNTLFLYLLVKQCILLPGIYCILFKKKKDGIYLMFADLILFTSDTLLFPGETLFETFIGPYNPTASSILIITAAKWKSLVKVLK